MTVARLMANLKALPQAAASWKNSMQVNSTNKFFRLQRKRHPSKKGRRVSDSWASQLMRCRGWSLKKLQRAANKNGGNTWEAWSKTRFRQITLLTKSTATMWSLRWFSLQRHSWSTKIINAKSRKRMLKWNNSLKTDCVWDWLILWKTELILYK